MALCLYISHVFAGDHTFYLGHQRPTEEFLKAFEQILRGYWGDLRQGRHCKYKDNVVSVCSLQPAHKSVQLVYEIPVTIKSRANTVRVRDWKQIQASTGMGIGMETRSKLQWQSNLNYLYIYIYIYTCFSFASSVNFYWWILFLFCFYNIWGIIFCLTFPLCYV